MNNQSIFQTFSGKSPVAQDFIWLGEYLDGTHLAEFNLQTGEENSFYKLKKDELIRFGLIGHGMKLIAYSDGIFSINGIVVEVGYRVGDKFLPLTGHVRKNYSDVITYKDAESIFVQGGGVSGPKINQYNFGYKTVIDLDGVTFNFKPIVKVPFNAPVHMNFWLVADQDLDGEFVILRNNREVSVVKAPLKKGVGGEVNWTVK
jgi:hypothetical protein